ncbi:FAD-dependent oxidoreductase [Saccharopolyspora rosea]|uniref:FAD-dependent oxidoreductase n=1 Tax=Saccharopolyspora rosea TaxID=524884 RepID=UPI0021D8F08A|nr:NAD(P)/FAD-dependent oxidoreductase [Saccharopolyspora rosea]
MKAVIVGAGVAGCAAALALSQVGVEAAVYEARPSAAEGLGAFLTIMPNGVQALHCLGADEATRRYGVTAGGVEVIDADGTLVRRSSFHGQGPPPFTLTRSDLVAGLREECARRGIPVFHGKQLADASSTPAGVVAEFADGSTVEADLLIGADGVWSRTRALLNPDAPAPRRAARASVFGFGVDLTDPPPTGTVRFCRGRHALLGYKTGPDGTGWWFARVPATPPVSTAAGWQQRVLDAVAGDRTPAAEIVRATEVDRVVGVHVYDLTSTEHASTPVWYNARTVLLGDAAHAADPATGQGASQALNDALVLAESLRSSTNPEEAFGCYEQRRRPATEEEARRSAAFFDR